LRGLIGYYGKHYVAILYDVPSKTWNLFDDSRVTQIGQKYSDVIAKVTAWRLQPAAVFYQVDGTQLPVLSNPKLAQQLPQQTHSVHKTENDTSKRLKIEPVDEPKTFVVNADTDLILQHLNQQHSTSSKKNEETGIPPKPVFKSPSFVPYSNQKSTQNITYEDIKKYTEMNLKVNGAIPIQEINMRLTKSPEPMEISNDEPTPTMLVFSPKPNSQPRMSDKPPRLTPHITPSITPRSTNKEEQFSGKNYR
jgi:hypothetical protein